MLIYKRLVLLQVSLDYMSMLIFYVNANLQTFCVMIGLARLHVRANLQTFCVMIDLARLYVNTNVLCYDRSHTISCQC